VVVHSDGNLYYALDVTDPGSRVFPSRPLMCIPTCFRVVFCFPCHQMTPLPRFPSEFVLPGWSPTPLTRVCRLFCRCYVGGVSTVDTRRPVLPAAGRSSRDRPLRRFDPRPPGVGGRSGGKLAEMLGVSGLGERRGGERRAPTSLGTVCPRPNSSVMNVSDCNDGFRALRQVKTWDPNFEDDRGLFRAWVDGGRLPLFALALGLIASGGAALFLAANRALPDPRRTLSRHDGRATVFAPRLPRRPLHDPRPGCVSGASSWPSASCTSGWPISRFGSERRGRGWPSSSVSSWVRQLPGLRRFRLRTI